MTKQTRATKERLDPAQAITEEIVALMEAGTVPWQQPWRSIGVPRRHEGTPYKGINAFLLGLRTGLAGHGSPCWMTCLQAKDLGACVRKGETSSLVVHYGAARAKGVEDGEASPAGDRSRSDEACGEAGAEGGAYRFLKSYRVFNACQIKGLDARFHPEPDRDGTGGPEPLTRWQRFLDAIGDGSGIPTSFGGDRACYVPSLDHVSMPELARFESAAQFYSTWWHELTHATKTEPRLDRSFGPSRFGNEAYAKEEAVAAISQCLADQLMGFGAEHIDNHAAYIDGWVRVLRGDRRFLFTAAAHAQRAVDWLVAAAAKGGVRLDAGHGLDGFRGMTDTSAADEMERQHEAA